MLYEKSKERDAKQKDLFDKVNRDEGVTFQPMTYRSNISTTRSKMEATVANKT